MKELGIIFTRHINSPKTNLYWQECYKCIRKVYPENIILIIDDNSLQEEISIDPLLNLFNCYIIKSEFPSAGELLSYYYFFKTKLFKKAIIIHDSVFIKNPLENLEEVKTINFLWTFTHQWDIDGENLRIITNLNIPEELKINLLTFYKKKDLWSGCFGLQSVITYNFIENLNNNYNIFDFLNRIRTRNERCCMERVFALICFYEDKNLVVNSSLYGDIHDCFSWGYTFDQYINNKKEGDEKIVKLWSGR